jgi:outer membrane protein TolC
MNLRPGEDYQLVIPDRAEIVDKVDISPEMMEQIALENRPEIRTISYEERINKKEAKAAILSLLPGLDINFGKSYSSNSFLFNNNWLSYGTQVSWNLLNIFKLPATKRELGARENVLEARRLALTMAIMTQVHVSLAQYEHAQREYKTAADYYLTQQKILDQLRSGVAKNTVTEQSLIREEMNMMVAEIKYDIAYSDVENAYAGIFASLGIDPFPIDADTDSVSSLTDSIMKYFEGLSLHEQLFSMKIE